MSLQSEGQDSCSTFPALASLLHVAHLFVGRVPGTDVRTDKAEVLRRLDARHREVRASLGVGARPFVTAEQVHGRGIAVVDSPLVSDQCFAGSDGILTNQPGVCLGIYVADCCAIYIVDSVRRAIGLLHSGRKGTELNIAGCAIELLRQRFGSAPADLVVQLSPCIRPPCYEVDFAGEIMRQCGAAGVQHLHDCGICTACDLDRFYSYRREKGRTGRMLALLALE